MKCVTCDIECGSNPGGYLTEAAALEPWAVKDVTISSAVLVCSKCAGNLWNYVKRVIRSFGDGVCIHCGTNCIGKLAYCFKLTDAFEPLTVNDVKINGPEVIFCADCAKPFLQYAKTLHRDHGGIGYS